MRFPARPAAPRRRRSPARVPLRRAERGSFVSSRAPLLLAGGGRRRLRIEKNLLRAPSRDLGHEQLIGIAAVDLVNRAELAETLASFAELAEDLAVELHLVDLAGNGPRGG